MTARHVILTVTWPVGGGTAWSTSEYLVHTAVTHQQAYREAVAHIRVAAPIPDGVTPNTVFFSLEPNDAP